MDYQSRIRIITSRLNEFLRQYQKPTHLDNEAGLTEIRTITEEINNLISASSSPDDLAQKVDGCFRSIRQDYTQRTWPTPAHFVKGMKVVQARSSIGADNAAGRPSVAQMKGPHEINADRMAAGDAVGDSWVYGRGAVELLREGMVTQDTLRKYRSALYFRAKEVGGPEYAAQIEEAMKARHAAAEAT